MTMSVRMDYTTVTKMQAVQTQMEVLSVLVIVDFLEMGKLALVSLRLMNATAGSTYVYYNNVLK